MAKHFWKRITAAFLSITAAGSCMLTNAPIVSAADYGSFPVVLKSKNPFDGFWHPKQGQRHGNDLAGRVSSCNANIMTVTIDGTEYMAYCMNSALLGSDNYNNQIGGSGYDVKVYDITDPILEEQKETEILLALQGVISAGGYTGGGDTAAKKLTDPYNHFVDSQGRYVHGDSSGETPVSGGTKEMFANENEAYAITKYAMWTVASAWESGSKWTPSSPSPGDVMTPSPDSSGWQIYSAASYSGGNSLEKLRTHLWNLIGWGTNWKQFNDETLYVDISDADGSGQEWKEDIDRGIKYMEFLVQTGMQGDNRNQVEMAKTYTVTPAADLSTYGLRLEKTDGTPIQGATSMTGSVSGGGIASEKFRVVADIDQNLSNLPKDYEAASVSTQINTFSIKYGVEQYENGNVQNYALVPVNTWKTVSKPVVLQPQDNTQKNYEFIIRKADGSKNLAGAEFHVTSEDGSFVRDVKTTSSGLAVVQVPKLGLYYVEETKAPSGYALDPTRYQVTVTEQNAGTVELRVENGKTAGLRIVKRDAQTGETLEGAVFTVEQIDGAYKTEVTTGASGTVILSDLPAGSYKVTEKTPPPHYRPSENPVQTIEVIEDTVVQLVYSNEPEDGIVRIKKIAENSGDPLEGVTFTIRRRDGAEQWTVTTDEHGEAEIELPADWYVITETDAPDNVQIDPTPHPVELEPGETYELKLTNVLKKKLLVEKRDSKTDELVPGMIFEIKSPEGDLFGAGNCGRGEGIYETDENGQVEFDNMEPGTTWVITELQAPAGYVLNPEPQTVKIENDITTVSIRNDQKPGLRLAKIDSDTGKPIMGAKFTFTIPGTSTVYTRVTDNHGMIFLEDLDVTAIIIREIEPAPGYIANDEPVTVQLVPNERTDVTFKNTSRPGLRICKIDTDGNPVADVVLKVSKADGQSVGEYTTDENGIIFIPNLEAGTYDVQEISAPPQYLVDSTVHKVTLEAGKIGEITLRNSIKPTLRIVKVDSVTKAPIKGVTFEVRVTDGQKIGDYVTDEDGEMIVTDLEAGVNYTVREIATLPGYVLDETPKQITLEANKVTTVQFENKAKSPIYILKLDSKTGEGIPGVRFRVTMADGSFVGEVTTDATGRAVLTNVPAGYITVTEISVPDGYVLDPIPQTKLSDGENPVEFTFYNEPYGSILIKKVNASTQNPLSGAIFKVTDTDGTVVGERYTSGPDGTVLVSGLEPNKAYIVTEVRAPEGFEISEAPKTVTVKSGETVEVLFEDKRIESFTIKKVDPDGKPIAGVTFRVSTLAGEEIAVVTTGADGLAVLTDVEPGKSYKVQEIAVPEGVLLDPTPQIVEVHAGEPTILTFVNDYVAGLKIIKTVEQTGEPLKGVTFRIEKPDGGVIGEYTTDENGELFVSLEPQTVVVREVSAPEGIQLDTTPRTVTIKANDVTELHLKNIQLAEFTIFKTDSNGNPLAGAVFELRTLDGRYVTTVTSGENGLAIVPDLAGDFIVTEIKSPEGYILDSTPHSVHIEAGRSARITIENDSIAGLKIIKTVEQTGEPLKGVTFRIEKPDGGVIGEYITDEQGQIFVSLEPQIVIVREISAPEGYSVDSTPRTVTIKENDIITLTYKDERLNGIRIRKVDADTGKGIYGVRIMITDENNDVVGVYTTDHRGYIEIDKELPDGIYYLEEIEAAPGYDLDKVVKRIHIQNGKTKEVLWENAREKGQIQILKTSLDANPITGQPAGSRLEGAVFEIARADTDFVVGYMVSDYRGVAASEPLPLGKYVVREITPPAFFQLNSTEFTIELKVQNDIVRVEVQNSSAQITTSVKKSGNTVVVPGQQMRYDFSDIANLSNVPLDSFYWHDELPSDVRLNVIHTGTWNQPGMTYSVTYKTNRNSSYRTLASGLLSTQAYDLDCSASKLGLEADEYITDFRFEFGTVQPGFREENKPMILVTVQPNLPNGHRFANRTDTGGQYGRKWFTSSFTWVTVVQGVPQKYPQTGY